MNGFQNEISWTDQAVTLGTDLGQTQHGISLWGLWDLVDRQVLWNLHDGLTLWPHLREIHHHLYRRRTRSASAELKGSFSKPRRRRRRERQQTKGLMRKTMAVHVRIESWYISLPSSAKQQREMTNFYVFWRTRTAVANFRYLLLKLNAVCACSACASFYTDRRTEQIYRVATFEDKI